MKQLLLVLVFCLSALMSNAQTGFTGQIDHHPTIHTGLSTNITAMREAFTNWPYKPNKLVTTEGGQSDVYSSAQGTSDFFAVYLKNHPDKGRVLQVTMSAVPFTGLATTPIVQDATTKEVFVVNLTTTDTRTGRYDYTADADGLLSRFYHTGSMTIDGETVFIKIRYMTPVYPTMQLTWGAGASPGNTGFFRDYLEGGPSSSHGTLPVAMIHRLTVTYNTFSGLPISNLVVSSEQAYRLEVSSDLTTWTEAPSIYLGIDTAQRQLWQIPHQTVDEPYFIRFTTIE